MIASICVCLHVCMHMRERGRESEGTEVILFCFLGKTCKVAILTEVLLLGMDVVELMRKCVALCRLQQLPDTSSPSSILNGTKGITSFKHN